MHSAEKLLVRMRASKYGWGYGDLETLYLGFGFKMDQGSGHTMFIHPTYPQLRATVARHRSLAVGYVQHAVKIIDELMRLEVG